MKITVNVEFDTETKKFKCAYSCPKGATYSQISAVLLTLERIRYKIMNSLEEYEYRTGEVINHD